MSTHFIRPMRPPGRAVAALAIAALVAVAVVSPCGAASPTDWAGTYAIPPATAAIHDRAPITQSLPRQRTTPLRVTGASDEQGVWQLVGPPSGVPFFHPTLVYDSARNRLIAFGGDDGSYRNDTWVFTIATGQWSELLTAGTPPPGRRLHGAVYDPSGDRLVIFGGWDDALLEDVWQLSLSGTPTWSPLDVVGPGPRAGFGTVYDAANDRMLIFGGFDGTTPPLGRNDDVWALSLGATPAWTQIPTLGPRPSARLGASTGIDPVTGDVFVFGGSDDGYSNELWKLALATSHWSRVMTGVMVPAARTSQVGGYDPTSHRFVVFGGYGEGAIFGDLWVIDPTASSPEWLDVTPDPSIRPRWGAGGVVTPSGDFYVVGGVNASGRIESDVWQIPVGNPTVWTSVGDLYPYRLQEVMVMDSQHHRFIAFGGTDGAYRNDTYVHPIDTGRGWQSLTTSGTPPSPRRLHTGIYDPIGDRLIIFGGFNDQLLGDLWQLTLSGVPTWSPLVAQGTPPSPRGGHVAIFDPVGQQMIVACGYDGVTLPAYRTGSTYALSLTGTPTWTRLPDGPARSSATAVFDPAHDAMVVFGGTNPNFLGDSWQLSLGGSPTWSQVAVSPGPAAREEQSAIYDTHRSRMVIFGGYDTPTPYSHDYDDLWALHLSGALQWQALTASGTGPSPRWGMKALYDAELDGMWLYGGWDYTYSQQLFFLQWSDPEGPAPIATVSAEAQEGEATFQWSLPSVPRTTATVQRSSDGVNWTAVEDALIPGKNLSFTDRSVTAGERYAWRSIVRNGITEMVSSVTWLTIPGSVGVPPKGVSFGLRLAQSVGKNSISVWCSLPGTDPGRVELIDVMGRVRDARDLSSLGKGRHRVELGEALEAGVFFVRLRSGERSASVKGVVLN